MELKYNIASTKYKIEMEHTPKANNHPSFGHLQ